MLGSALAFATAAPSLAAPRIQQGATVQAVAPTAPVDFEIYLPLRDKAGLDSLLKAQQTPGGPQYHVWLTPAQFGARFGPTPDSMARAQAAATAAGLQVTATRTRSFHVSGDAQHVNAFLHTTLNTVRSPAGATRLIGSGPVTLPAGVQQEGGRVLDFNDIPLRRPTSVKLGPIPANRSSVTGPYWYDDLKQAYDYPAYDHPANPSQLGLDGTGVKVAVLMSDLLYPDDVATAFNHELFTVTTLKPVPTVTTVTVDGGGVTNGPGSFEASLDVQQVLGGAPGASVTLVSIPDLSDAHIADGYNYIVNANTYDMVNSSFGGCELEYTAAYNGGTDMTSVLTTLDEIFAQGNTQGITFVASSGDQSGLLCPNVAYSNGGSNGVFVLGVSTPADDPNVTAVGGGNLVTLTVPLSLTSAYVRESANADPLNPYDIYGTGFTVSGGYWGAGGGIGTIFAQPAYQVGTDTGSTSFRTVPDVGMQVGGCPGGAKSCSPDDSAAIVIYNGAADGVIGTSVSSPEFVGALALLSQSSHGRLGNVNYYLYAMGASQTAMGGNEAQPQFRFYHRSIPGYDGHYNGGQPSHNYNYIYGLGSPDIRKLFEMTNYPTAGLPQTPYNP
jgi:subtilase family serine protease